MNDLLITHTMYAALQRLLDPAVAVEKKYGYYIVGGDKHYGNTILALRRRGFIDAAGKITLKGREAIGAP